jgi:hypothetical protein
LPAGRQFFLVSCDPLSCDDDEGAGDECAGGGLGGGLDGRSARGGGELLPDELPLPDECSRGLESFDGIWPCEIWAPPIASMMRRGKSRLFVPAGGDAGAGLES